MDGGRLSMELGQMLFSGQADYRIDADDHIYVQKGLVVLSSFLAEAKGTDEYDLTGNVGGEFTSPEFDLRAYCWCDGDQHPDGCPPNFYHHATGFGVSWYKYLGRGTLLSRHISARDWSRILIQCLNHVGRNVEPDPEYA